MTESLPAQPKANAALQYHGLQFHPLANLFPLIEGEEFDALVEDIRTRGLLNPIILHQGKIIDGRNRHNAAKAAGYPFTDRDFKELAPGLDPEAFVISANVHRRQLSTKQKREFIAKLIESKPAASDSAIAKLACCDKKTVASVRDELRNRTVKFSQDWEGLSGSQRAEFITAKRPALVALLNGSAARPEEAREFPRPTKPQ